MIILFYIVLDNKNQLGLPNLRFQVLFHFYLDS